MLYHNHSNVNKVIIIVVVLVVLTDAAAVVVFVVLIAFATDIHVIIIQCLLVKSSYILEWCELQGKAETSRKPTSKVIN